jgi:CDP-diacylglycerol--serine O-phosphatidyltransferase
MFCGFYSILSSMNGQFEQAAWAIVAAGIFDSLDGRIARLAKATSQFGVEYDSLSDLTSFGMAPAILLYRWTYEPMGRLGLFAAFLFLVCAALRLARFNVSTGTAPKGFFQGVASPIAAGMVCTFVIFSKEVSLTEVFIPSVVIGVSMAFLMVSTLQFPSFKEMNWRSKSSFGILMLGLLSIISVAIHPELMMFATLSGYVVSGLIYNLILLMRRKPKAGEVV